MMNDLGLTLAWSAVQISLVLIPGVLLHALATRRNPASGAWVASLSLGLALSVGILSLVSWDRLRGSVEITVTPRETTTPLGPGSTGGGEFKASVSLASDPPRFTLAQLQSIWRRLEKTTAEPAARCRPWGRVLALVCLAGAGMGMLRLFIGLWAIRLCRRGSRPVDHPELTQLLENLRESMRCRRPVEIRETGELTTPATAGWRHAVILLPEDWRSWDDEECRTVLAHELAHICRHDYLTGILAQIALALHFYHPLVHWLSARLRLEQELAADALGARFAGGKTVYLRCLSQLALRQDGRPPSRLVRAFLPAKGTLIRRIVMLRAETNTNERPWSVSRRLCAALLLFAISSGAFLLQGPAHGMDGDAPAVGSATTSVNDDHQERLKPFDLSYVTDDNSQGFVGFRPSAIFQRSGMGVYRTMLNVLIGQLWSKAANGLKFDPTKPGQRPLRVEMFEEVTTKFRIWRTEGKKPNGRLSLGEVIAIHTTEPIDWVTLARVFQLGVTETRDQGRTYYKLESPMFGPDGGFFCPDDRTVVIGSEKSLLAALHRRRPSPAPVFARGKDWDRLLSGLLVVAMDNRGGRLSNVIRDEKSDDPEVAVATSVFAHTDFWTLGVENRDEIVLRAVATCPEGSGSEMTTRAIKDLLALVSKEGDTASQQKPPKRAIERKAQRMALDFSKNMQIDREGHSVLLRNTGIGTIADFASLVAAGIIQ